MKRILKIAGIILGILILGAFIAFKFMTSTDYVPEPTLKNQLQKSSVSLDGQTRDFLWYSPPQLPELPNILFVLHGSNSSGAEIREQTAYRFDQLADEKGFVVVYPTGYFKHWNDCRSTADYEANVENIDDITFLKTIESEISNYLKTSFSYRFATGHSNGGHFCFKLALEAPDWIDAIAPISANVPIEENLDCKSKGQFVPMLLINGTADAINPYQGGLVSILGNTSRGTVLSTEKSIEYWTQLGNCEANPKITKIVDANTEDESQIEQWDWVCDSIPQVRLYKVINGGHTIPSTRHKYPRILGTTNQDLDAPKAILEFFEASTR